MNNIYLIYGSENYLIKKELSKIIDNSNVMEDSIIIYNLDEVNVSNVIDEASMVGLFSDKKFLCKVKNTELNDVFNSALIGCTTNSKILKFYINNENIKY